MSGVTESVYTYDTNGNRLSRERGADVETGVYDAQDRISSYGDCSYTMDAAGFLSERHCGAGAETFEYDARGSLRRATRADGAVITYVIDPQGRRIGRRVNGALDKGWLYWDSLRPAAQLNSSGQLEAVYIYGTRANVPEYIVEKAAGGDVLYRVIADHLGTPRRIVRSSDGVVVHELDVDEWGNVVREVGSRLDLHPFGFAGGLRDRDTGLVRYGARDYDPVTGRWTARDPILFAGGQSNLYAYVNNDPVNRVDPAGLADWGDWAIAIGRTINPWTGPTNWLGIAYGLADGSFEGIDNGRITFSGTGRGYDRTIGDVICYSGSGPSHPNRDHEMAHTEQHTLLGPAYGPAHLASQGASWLLTGTYDEANPLEWGPNQTPPTPWGWP